MSKVGQHIIEALRELAETLEADDREPLTNRECVARPTVAVKGRKPADGRGRGASEMSEDERLQNIRECYGPTAWRVGDPPTAADVELLLRSLADAEQRAADVEQRIAAWMRREANRLDSASATAHATFDAHTAMRVERMTARNFADAIASGEWDDTGERYRCDTEASDGLG